MNCRFPFLCIFLLSSTAAIAGTISVDPSTTIGLGDQATVSVNASGILDLYAFQFDINFNPSVLSVVSVTEGSLFNTVGVFFSPGLIDDTLGSVQFIGDSLSGLSPGLSGTGALVNVVFASVGVGASPIYLSNLVLLDSQLSDIVATSSDTKLTVRDASVTPEPGAIVLFMSGIGAIFVRICIMVRNGVVKTKL